MADWPEGFSARTVVTPHGDFVVWSGGNGPALWCLHGFPDTVDTWREIVGPLAEAGYSVHALQMPGYGPACLQSDYSLPALADTVVMVMESVSPGQRLRLIGHDWGAALSQAIATLRPELIEAIVLAALPHVRHFLTHPNPTQLRRSWYIGYFQLPLLPERRAARDDFAFIERIWQDWSPTWQFTAQDIAPVKQAFAEPGVLRAALAYYRALPGAVLKSVLPGRGRELGVTPVPTMAIAGEQDGCIGFEMFSGQERLFPAGYTFRPMAAGHFMHREQPQAFIEAALEAVA